MTAIQFIEKPAFQLSVLLMLFVTAFAVRMYHIDKPPHDFAPLRQYQSAHIARDYYFQGIESLPEWRRTVARINAERMGLLLEPRIMENISVFGYRVLGGEHLWFPRVLSSLFWSIGGIFLFLIARKLVSSEAAVLSIAFYLFLPFSILASRSFQPDPLMVMLMLFSVFMIMKYYETPTLVRVLFTAIVSAMAILVKPQCLFLIFGAYCAVGIHQHGIRKAFTRVHTIAYGIVSLLPICLYYAYGILTNVGYLNELAQGSFIPHLILKSYFWQGWFILIGKVVGYIAFAGAIIGFFMIKEGKSRALLSGLLIGYICFGLFFTMLIHTHDYYQLQFIPVVALSLGPAALWVIRLLSKRWKMTVLSVIVLIGASSVIINLVDMEKYFSKNKNNLKFIAGFIGIHENFKKYIFDNFEREIEMAKEIGETVGHSTNTVLLTPHFGRIIAYNGELSGLPWPKQSSLNERRERGLRPLSKNELYNPGYLTIRTHGKYIKYTPDYFIVTDFKEFDAQGDLKNFLNMNFPVLAQSEDYLIFDLRKMSENDQ